jgi:ribosomal protein S18 acetylase RimI-like enzyme
MGWEVRELTAADEIWLWDLLYMAIYVQEGQPPPDRSILRQPDLARYVADWGRTGDRGVAAVESAAGRPVGAAWLRLWTAHDRGYGYMAEDIPELSIAVSPGYRGRGMGTALMQALLVQSDAVHAAVSLSVSAGNPARRLYARLGFVEVSEAAGSLTMVRRAGERQSGRRYIV